MKEILVFHVRLEEIFPAIWRRLELRREWTFWNLHCAIQDAMPWEDRHLHEFQFPAGDDDARIGIPNDDYPGEEKVLPSWETPLREWFVATSNQCRYHYDFGDDWIHTVTLESRRPAEPGGRYPRCTAGERRCPPEDVGGPFGYQHFLEAMLDPGHEDHAQFRDWIGMDWDPERFSPDEVTFSVASRRLRRAGLG
ncbi:MAG TPA: plasmid pRiA4b ORF-3 family protein [Thermoanaerobaculia bacterium]|jgi:hypothetical protein